MATGTRLVDFSPRVEIALYLKRARQMGKSLILASKQWIDFDPMVVLQRMEMPMVVVEQ